MSYNEQTFKYFLAIERERFERSGRPFVLLLAALKEQPGVSARIDTNLTRKLFFCLQSAVRETDFIGWYREECVAGIVLTELGDRSMTDVAALIRRRVSQALRGDLPAAVGRRLELRVDLCESPCVPGPDPGVDADFHARRYAARRPRFAG